MRLARIRGQAFVLEDEPRLAVLVAQLDGDDGRPVAGEAGSPREREPGRPLHVQELTVVLDADVAVDHHDVEAATDDGFRLHLRAADR